MAIEHIIVATCLALLGVAHSILGESGIIKPLLAAEWTIETPRWATERILRFAWHLTSITWLAIAAAVIGADLLIALGLMSLVSAAIIFVMLRGHLAWPIFLLAGLAAFRDTGALSDSTLAATSTATVAVLAAAGLLHVYWALGGRWQLDKVMPTSGEEAVNGNRHDHSCSDFRPGPLLTMVVAFLLFAFAALVAMTAAGTGPDAVRWLTGIGVATLALRAIGDARVAGFTKTVRHTEFARADDAVFTPLVVFLALGASGALLL